MLLNFILNYLFIGIPQTLVFIFLVLFCVKEYEYFKPDTLKTSIKDLFIIGVLPCALFLNFLYYFSNLEPIIRIFLTHSFTLYSYITLLDSL